MEFSAWGCATRSRNDRCKCLAFVNKIMGLRAGSEANVGRGEKWAFYFVLIFKNPMRRINRIKIKWIQQNVMTREPRAQQHAYAYASIFIGRSHLFAFYTLFPVSVERPPLSAFEINFKLGQSSNLLNEHSRLTHLSVLILSLRRLVWFTPWHKTTKSVAIKQIRLWSENNGSVLAAVRFFSPRSPRSAATLSRRVYRRGLHG